MSSRINKEWIKDRNIDSDAYRDGILGFITFITENCHGDMHSCPCKRCRNGNGFMKIVDISFHLMKYGMDDKYTIWYFHGETSSVEPQLGALSGTPQEVDKINFPKLNDLVNDVCEMFTGEGNSAFLEADKDANRPKSKKYDRLHQLASKPLHPSANESRHKVMYALVKLNGLKNQFSLSDGAMGGILNLLKELLPEDNNLTISYTQMKNMIKDIGMDCVKYDVCVNNCMIFWKEHASSTECVKCGARRYKFSSKFSNGKRILNFKGKVRYRQVARKVMRHFPLIPRLKRLYTIEWIAEKMTWHSRAKKYDEFLRHPCDSADWAHANILWKEFSRDPRNIRLAIATDGFNPNNMFGRSYSCWPVVIQPLNLPPSLCMKSEFSMLTVLIPGPKSPTNNLDVFLQPVNEELQTLWRGVEAWDASKNEYFTLKAMLMWGIHDFPAYGMLSGCTVSGHYACPICSKDTPSEYLHGTSKCCYQRSRMFLPKDHHYRFDTSKKTFNGKREDRVAPRKLTGEEIDQLLLAFEKVEQNSSSSKRNTSVSRSRKRKGKEKAEESHEDEDDANLSLCLNDADFNGFWKRSILFDLEYWKYHDTRHNLDVMHIEKNVTETLLGTILSVKGSSNKDSIKAREELEKNLKLKKDLWMQEVEGSDKRIMPQAPFALTKEGRLTFYQSLKALKVPIGFSSNFNNSVILEPTMGFVNLKSHDYHVIMQHLLPALLLHSFPDHKLLYKAIQRISIFFNLLCAKVIFREHLLKAKKALVEALCVLEIYFPPSFFVIMIHLMHHLASEALSAGPPRYRAMWLFERLMKNFKKWSRNKRFIEGSIANAYLLHEASLYAMEYISFAGEGTHKRNLEAFLDDEFDESIGQRALSKGKTLILNNIQYEQVRRWVLLQSPNVDEWKSKFESTFRCQQRNLSKHRVDDFIPWLRDEAFKAKDMTILKYADGPLHEVTSYNKFECNGYTFSTLSHEENLTTQSSGVSLKAYNKKGVMSTYYGVIRDIIDLDYTTFSHVVFYCDWIDPDDKNAYRVDPTSKLVMVNLNKPMSKKSIHDEPFILASQASQVFYLKDTKFDGWSIVLHNPRRLTKSIDSLDIDRSMYNSIVEENEKLIGLIDT